VAYLFKLRVPCLVMILFFVLLLSVPVLAEEVGQSTASVSQPVKVFEQPVTSGVLYKEYRWETPDGPVEIHVLDIDLTNPYVRLDVIPGAGKLNKRLNVSAMARNSGAVAATNGDFFNTRGEGAPIGPMVAGGRWVSSPARIEGLFALGITKDRKASIQQFSFQGRVVSPSGEEFPLAGLNKAAYWESDGTHSHADKLHLYNDFWGGGTRGEDGYTTPTEILVRDGRVVEVAEGKYLSYDGVPEGMQILRGDGKAARFLLENFKSGDKIKIEYRIEPEADWSMVLGGHALLVDRGEKIPYGKENPGLGGLRARMAAGVSQNGKRVLLVGVEGKSEDSVGLDLDQLSSLLVHLGAWRALNLDGGGSATMVARPLGAWEVRRVFRPEEGYERYVVNGLGIYTEAPPGELKGLILDTKRVFLVGERGAYELRGYDQYFNPVRVDNVSLSGGGEIIEIDKGEVLALAPGKAEIKAARGSVSASVPVEVLGKRDITMMKLSGPAGSIIQGESYQLSLDLTTFSGYTREVPFDLVKWQFYGFDGEVSPEGKLKVSAYSSARGFVVARYQEFSAPLVLNFTGGNIPVVPNPQIRLVIGEKSLELNGKVQEMDVAPLIIKGRTMIPVRFVSQALGAQVFWDNESRRATIVRGDKWLDLWPEDPQMVVDGRSVLLDQPPVIISGRVMLPLRAVGEAMDLTVHWDAAAKSIYLQ